MVTASEIVYDVLVSIMFVVVAGLLLFPSNLYLPLDRRIACIWGASICAIVAYCFRDSVNPLSFVDVDVLLVLSAIMGINFLLLRHPWTTWIIERMQWYIRNDVDKAFYIVSALSFFISQVIMNDGLCLMIVHPVLDAFRKKRRNSINNIVDPKYNPAHHVHDPFYFMLNIACSSNIGSVMTFAGNPQNLIIAQYLGNYMNCAVYYLYMILPALVTWLFTLGLINYYRKQAVKKLQQSGDSLTLVEMTNINNSIRDGEADEENGKEEDRKSEDKKEDSEIDAPTSPFHRKPEKTNSKRSVNADAHLDQLSPNSKKRALSELEVYNSVIKDDDPDDDIVVPRKGGMSIANRLSKLNVEGKHLIFPAMLLPLIILEFVGVIPLTGLFITMSISMVAVVILFDYYLADHSAVTKSHEKIHEITVYIEDLFHSLDYNLLVIFTGLFIVSGSFLETGIPSFFWKIMAGHTAFKTNLSIFVISIYIIVFSQLVGNVPLVYLAKVEVEKLDRQPQIFGWLILAYVSTIAGNFTLVGSAANIIVVEKAMRHKDCPVKINAKEHFRVCGVITLVSIAFGVLILSLEMVLVG